MTCILEEEDDTLLLVRNFDLRACTHTHINNPDTDYLSRLRIEPRLSSIHYSASMRQKAEERAFELRVCLFRQNSDYWKSSVVSACIYTRAPMTSWRVSVRKFLSRNIWRSSIPNFRACLTMTRTKVRALAQHFHSSFHGFLSSTRPHWLVAWHSW